MKQGPNKLYSCETLLKSEQPFQNSKGTFSASEYSIYVNPFLSFSGHLYYDFIGVYNFHTTVLTNLHSTNAAGLFPTLPTSPTKWTQIMIWEEDCVIKASVGGLIEISKLSLNKQTLKDPCRNIVFQ